MENPKKIPWGPKDMLHLSGDKAVSKPKLLYACMNNMCNVQLMQCTEIGETTQIREQTAQNDMVLVDTDN